jgi:hypothetical protein
LTVHLDPQGLDATAPFCLCYKILTDHGTGALIVIDAEDWTIGTSGTRHRVQAEREGSAALETLVACTVSTSE